MAKKMLKNQKKHRKGTFRRYTLYYLLALVLLVSAALLLSMTVFFRINKITVVGNSMYDDNAVVSACGIELGDNLLRAHTDEAAEKVLTAYPYFESVSVHRVLPDEIEISVTQATAKAACRGENGRYTLLSAGARALETDLALCPEGLISTDGVELISDVKTKSSDKGDEAQTKTIAAGEYLASAEQSRYAVLLDLLDALDAAGLTGKIDIIDVSDVLDLRLLYDGRLAISAGGDVDLDYKMRFAALAIEQEVTDTTVGTLDVSQKPTARLREYDIYTEESWPFAADLMAEYERHIVKETPWLTVEEPDEAAVTDGSTDAQTVSSEPEAAGEPAESATGSGDTSYDGETADYTDEENSDGEYSEDDFSDDDDE